MLKYCLTGMLLFSLKLWSQEIKPLSIGDKVPSINLNTIFNTPAFESNPSTYTNKLVILDFMASNCSSCLKVLPCFDSIQKIYGNRIQIFLVTEQRKEIVKKFLQSHPEIKLTVIGEDTVLKKYFPHTFISHEVWIYDGVVKAITQPEYVNERNIKFLLAGNKIDWPVKNDLPDFDYSKPLLSPVYHSCFSSYIPNVLPKYLHTIDSNKNISRTLMVNMGIIDMFIKCYGKPIPIGHLLLKGNDSRFLYNDKEYREEWNEKNIFCFEAVLPLASAEEYKNKLLSDIAIYTGVHGSMQKLTVPGYILSADPTIHLVSKTLSRSIEKQEGIKSISVAELIMRLDNSWYGVPVINKTGYSNQYMNLTEETLDSIPVLQNALRQYGLTLTSAVITTQMLVLETN